MYKLVLLTLCLTLLAPRMSAQTYRFEVFSSGASVGFLEAIREVNDEAEKISISIDINLPEFQHNYTFKSYSSYMDGSLVDVVSTTEVNKEMTESQTTLKNGSYTVITNGFSHILDETLILGTDLLYFEQPVDFEDVYLLDKPALLKVQEVTGNQWQITDGKRILTYVYRDEKLVSLLWRYPDFELSFRLKN